MEERRNERVGVAPEDGEGEVVTRGGSIRKKRHKHKLPELRADFQDRRCRFFFPKTTRRRQEPLSTVARLSLLRPACESPGPVAADVRAKGTPAA